MRRKLKAGDIVVLREWRNYTVGARYIYYRIVILPVNLVKTPFINTDHSGLHGFYGKWYGNNPWSIHSYGKIHDLQYTDPKDYYVVGHISKSKGKLTV